MKISPITFCNSSVNQLIDNATKAGVVEGIRGLVGLVPDEKTYRVMRTPRDISFLRNPHLVAPATRGQRFWLYLTQIDHRNSCLLVERSIKPGYPYPKILVLNYQFNETLYQNTLMEVEILDNAGGRDAPLMLLTDLLALKARDVRNWDPIRRFNVLHTILEKQYHENMVLQPCTIQIKRLFASTDWDALIAFTKTLPYVTRGLVFYPLNTRYPVRIWLDDQQEFQHSKSTDQTAAPPARKPRTLRTKQNNDASASLTNQQPAADVHTSLASPVSTEKACISLDSLEVSTPHTLSDTMVQSTPPTDVDNANEEDVVAVEL
jgi:hypothetical protein